MAHDPRPSMARRFQQEAQDLDGRASVLRHQRDRIVRQLRAEDPKRWTYPAIAEILGCSPELVAAIVKQPRRPLGD